MVAVRNSDAEKFLSRDLGAFSAFLVFGTDAGLIGERVRRIVRSLVDDPGDPFQLARLAGEDAVRDTPRLADEAQTVPLFGGRRAVLLEAGGKPVHPAVELFLAAPSSCPVVIEAGALKRDAPLRRLVEGSKRAAAIECFPDDAGNLRRLVDGQAAAANLAIAADARELLVSLLGADRMASRSEIAKLVLYAHGAERIEIEHVEAAVTGAVADVAGDAVDAALSGDLAALESALKRLRLDAGTCGALLGAASRRAMALHRRAFDGAGAGSAWTPKLPRPRQEAFDRQAAALDGESLLRIILKLDEASGLVRREPRLAENHARRALWSVAQVARGRRSGRARPG